MYMATFHLHVMFICFINFDELYFALELTFLEEEEAGGCGGGELADFFIHKASRRTINLRVRFKAAQ